MLLRCRNYRCFFSGRWTTNNQLISICFFLLKLINSKIKICTNSFCILWAHSVNVESFRNSINKLLHPYIRREQQNFDSFVRPIWVLNYRQKIVRKIVAITVIPIELYLSTELRFAHYVSINVVNCFIKLTILNNMIWLQISDGFSCSFSTLFFSFLKCSANPLKNQGDRTSKYISWKFFLSTKMINESKMIFSLKPIVTRASVFLLVVVILICCFL